MPFHFFVISIGSLEFGLFEKKIMLIMTMSIIKQTTNCYGKEGKKLTRLKIESKKQWRWMKCLHILLFSRHSELSFLPQQMKKKLSLNPKLYCFRASAQFHFLYMYKAVCWFWLLQKQSSLLICKWWIRDNNLHWLINEELQ